MNLQNQLDYLPSLLDGVVVPAPLDADKLKSEIMFQCGLLTPVYSEPATMKALIAHWFASRDWNFAHLVKIIQAEYSPIENVDRYDSTTTSMIGSESESESESTTTTRGREFGSGRDAGTDRSRSEVRNLAGNDESTVSAFNSSAYQPANNMESSESESVLESESILSSESMSESESEGIDNDRTRAGYKNRGQVESFSQHMHGNIGVTTNQQMINQELDLINRFNIYKWITFMLRSELFLEVY